jgi:hypothetical protein
MKSFPMKIHLSPLLLAAFLAIQVSPLWASTKDVAGIEIVVNKVPGAALAPVKTFGNGTFSVHLDSAGTYQVTAVGVKNLKRGTAVKLSFSVAAAKAKSAPPTKTSPVPVNKTATAVLDASGKLVFPGNIQVSEASLLTGRLDIAPTSIPVKDPLSPVK